VARLNELALETLQVGRDVAARPSSRPTRRAEAPAATAPTVAWPDGEEERIRLLERLLAENDGNVTAVARLLGKHGSSLRRWIKLYGINPAQYRGS
jgi:hypothetical protein